MFESASFAVMVTVSLLVDESDALIMYYVYTLDNLTPLVSGKLKGANLQDVLSNVAVWRRNGRAVSEGDLNGDGVVDGNDALVMYYAYIFGELMGNGQSDTGSQSIRVILLNELVDQRISAPQDADYRLLLRRANQLRTIINGP